MISFRVANFINRAYNCVCSRAYIYFSHKGVKSQSGLRYNSKLHNNLWIMLQKEA